MRQYLLQKTVAPGARAGLVGEGGEGLVVQTAHK